MPSTAGVFFWPSHSGCPVYGVSANLCLVGLTPSGLQCLMPDMEHVWHLDIPLSFVLGGGIAVGLVYSHLILGMEE